MRINEADTCANLIDPAPRLRGSARLVEQAETLDAFRAKWIVRDERERLIDYVRAGGFSPKALQALEEMEDFDLYDVLAEVGYGMNPHTRLERAKAFNYKHSGWLEQMPAQTANTLKAIAAHFARVGTEGLENAELLQTPEVREVI